MTVTIDGTTGVNTPAVSGMTTPLSVGQGGTGLTTATGVLVGAGSSVSAVAAGTNGNVLTSNGTTWVSQAAGGTAPVYTVAATPGTWTKPATVKAIRVTVVGGGGGGGSATLGSSGGGATGGGGGGGGGTAIKLYPAPSLPGPQPYTVGTAGNTSSFGVAPATVISATGGSAGGATSNPTAANAVTAASGGAGGAGSNGDANIGGSGGGAALGYGGGLSGGFGFAGSGGASSLGGGGVGTGSTGTPVSTTGANGQNYGGGAAGGLRGSNGAPSSPGTTPGGTGATGVVIIEEFY